MERNLYLVFSNPVEGKEDQYNEWYDNVHLADVMRIPGVVSAARYDFRPTSFGEATAAPTEHRYLAVFELDREPEGVLTEMGNRAGTPEMMISEAMNFDTVQSCVWKLRDS